MRELLTAEEVAQRLRVHRNTVYDWRLNEGLPAIRVGTRLRFRWDEVEAWMEYRTNADRVTGAAG